MRRSLTVRLFACALLAFGWLLVPAGPARADPSVTQIAVAAAVTMIPGYVLDLPQFDKDTDFLKISGGAFDGVDGEKVSIMGQLEYSPGWTFFRLRPAVGFGGNGDGGLLGYASLKHDFHFTRYFVVTASSGPAFFAANNSKFLGSYAVLRSGIEIAFRFQGGARFGISMFHMSHGKLFNDVNPGTEIVSLNFTVPLN